MRLIVIDTFNTNFPSIVTDEDGNPKIFNNHADAQTEADDCQEAIIVEI
jgi:hypothetical protein